VFIGFVQDFANTSVLTGGATITGHVVNIHNSRPPDYAFYMALPSQLRVGLNELEAPLPRLYAGPCNADSSSPPQVPPATTSWCCGTSTWTSFFATLNVTGSSLE